MTEWYWHVGRIVLANGYHHEMVCLLIYGGFCDGYGFG